MYNFDFVIPSVLILIIFLAYFIFKPKVPILRYKVFLSILIVQLLVVAFDVISSYSDSEYQKFSIPINYFFNMAYFVLYVARIYAFFVFTLVILQLNIRLKKSVQILMSLVFIITELIILSSVFTHAVFSIDGEGYHRGPVYDVLYICFLFYLLLSIILVIMERKHLRRYEMISALGYNLVLIVGNVVRFLLPKYLVMNTFCLLAIVILFLSYVNTDLYLCENGAFNRRALREYLDEKLPGGNCSILGLTLENFFDQQEVYGTRQMTLGTAMIVDYLKKEYPQYLIFYLDVGRYAIAGDAGMDPLSLAKEIQERFSRPWKAEDAELYLLAGYAYLESDSRFEKGEEVVENLLLTFSEINEGRSVGSDPVDLNHENRFEQIVAVKRFLTRAIEENKVEVFLQPLVEAGTGKLIGAEALARLRDDTGKLIPPKDFIGIAERNGQINPMSDQILEKVCIFIEENDMEKMGLQFINVNLSPVQCQNPELCSQITEIVNRHGVSPDFLHLEITEQTMIDYSVLLDQMAKLKEAGFCFALDDYGSGYSNMLRVRRFPFTAIKIDMEMVRWHCENPDRLLPSTIELFKDFGLSITAEGIETEDMARTMTEIGCDYLQGYCYSRPIPIGEFLEKYS